MFITNIVFSLIDNDINYIQGNDINKIKQVKQITKVFYIWAEKKYLCRWLIKTKKMKEIYILLVSSHCL